MEPELQNEKMNELFEAVLALKNVDECQKFFRDICTYNELNSLSERWSVARLLAKKIPYRSIVQQTGSSSATVTRVAHWLNHGEGGYRLLLDRLN